MNAQNTFKATKEIAAGQEIFVRYGDGDWFKEKNIPYTDVDYASTMWRPDLHPFPCRQDIRVGTARGRHMFVIVADFIPSATPLEVSLCVEMSLNVVDQFPFLWDFVIVDSATQTVCKREDSELYWQPVCSYIQKCLPTCRHASLCHTPRKSRPRPILTSLTCACHSQP